MSSFRHLLNLLSLSWLGQQAIKIYVNIKVKVENKNKDRRRTLELYKELSIMMDKRDEEFKQNGFSKKEEKLTIMINRFINKHNLKL